eukprot:6456696-Amphidinium_carterae.1
MENMFLEGQDLACTSGPSVGQALKPLINILSRQTTLNTSGLVGYTQSPCQHHRPTYMGTL